MCGMVGARYIVFEVLGTGGRSSHEIWGRFAAATGRVVSSVFNGDELSCEIHVDDPLLAAPAKDHASSLSRCWPSPSWASLPSWDKACLGDRVVWVGARLLIEDSSISVAIPEDELEAFRRQPTQFLSTNFARKKDLRSFCGKLSFVAGMVPLRCGPFVDMAFGGIGLTLPVAVGSRSLSALPRGSLVGGLPVRWSSRSQRHGPRRRTIWPLMPALGVLPVCYLKVSNQWHGTPPRSRRTKFASSGSASESPSTTPPGRPSLSWWPCGSGCEELVSWRESRPIPCPHSEAWYNSPASPPTLTTLHERLSWTLSWACTQWSSRRTSRALPTGYRMSCHGCGLPSRTRCRSLFSACHHNVRQFGIVGSGKTAVLKHRSGALARRLTPPGHQGTTCYATWSSRLDLCSLLGQAGRGSHPVPLTAWHTWVRRRPMQPRKVTPLSEGFASPVAASRSNPSAHDALVPALAYGTTVAPYRRSANGRRSLLPTTHGHSGRPSGAPRSCLRRVE